MPYLYKKENLIWQSREWNLKKREFMSSEVLSSQLSYLELKTTQKLIGHKL